MKTKALYLLASIVLLSLVSCTNEVQELAGGQSQALKQIVMTTQDFQPESDSRTVYQIADGAVKCTWAENDTVGVFPTKGAQAYFPMASGAGTKNATFDGEGWALKDGFTYASYYPYIGNAYLDRNAVPVSYTGQTQVGNGSMAHLGDYDYMVATPTAPEFGSAQFMFKHLSALVQLKITVPQPAIFTSVKLVTDTQAFAVEGKVDIMAETPGITSTKISNEIVLNLQKMATTRENEVITFYMMLPPADLSRQALKAVIVSDKGSQEIALEGKNFKSGTAYALSKINEGSYKDGVIHIVNAGTMKELLGSECLSITSLKVVGPINGDDVRCLRQMLGASDFDEEDRGKLSSLDLSEASIVQGGKCYFDEYSWEKYYTTNDVIGSFMFCGCSNLQSIVLPDGITSIGEWAFYQCYSLLSIDIPDSVTSIDRSAFHDCSSLTSISIPDGVTSIGEWAFYHCYSLEAVYITNLSAWCKISFIGSFSNPLWWNCAKLYLNNHELTDLIIPKGITRIKDSAFAGCYYLASVTMGNEVVSIGRYAFYNCYSLLSIDISDGITSIGEFAFDGCSSLTSIDIPDGVTSISRYAFHICSSLTSIDIPDKVSSIGESAFEGCISLTSIDIPNRVTSIGNSAFRDCSSLASVAIGNSVTSIGNLVFCNCSSLTSVTIGAGVTSIGYSAFYYCPLRDVYCYATTPPSLNNSSYYASFPNYGTGTTLYVPAGCGAKYNSSDWAKYFKTIKEM